MSDLTDDELAHEISRKREAVMNKRKADALAVAAASEKRARLLRELDEMNFELSEADSAPTNSSSSSWMSSASTSSSSSTASSSSSSSYVAQAAVPETSAPQPKAKSSMFAYWTVEDKTAIEIEQIDQQRIGEAKANSESRQSELHRPRKLLPAKTTSKDSASRTISASTWVVLRRKINGDNKK